MNPKRSGGVHVLGKLHDHNALPTGVKHCIAQSAGQKTMAKIGRGTASAMNPVTAAIAKQLTSCSAMSPALPAAPHESIGAKSVSAMLMSSVSNDPLHTSAQTAPVTRATERQHRRDHERSHAGKRQADRIDTPGYEKTEVPVPETPRAIGKQGEGKQQRERLRTAHRHRRHEKRRQIDAEQAIRTDRAI